MIASTVAKFMGDAISKAFAEGKSTRKFWSAGNHETREYCESPRKNRRQFLIKTLECVMMAATNHSSLKNRVSKQKQRSLV